MKSCDYCGKENDDAGVYCWECGTAFPPRVPPIIASSQPPLLGSPIPSTLPQSPRILDGAIATGILCIYLGAQYGAGIVSGLFAGFTLAINESPGSGHDFKNAFQPIMPFTVLAIMVFSAVGLFWSAIGFKLDLKDNNPTGAAWVRGSWLDIAKGLVSGILTSVLAIVVIREFGFHPHLFREMSPLVRMSETPGFPQIIWVISAVLLAPPIEELLFRGILYGGYRKSMGAIAATIITTIIFVSLHIGELLHQPMGTFGIASLALVALWQRLRSKAIGPAIATHFGYNLTIVLTTLASQYFQ